MGASAMWWSPRKTERGVYQHAAPCARGEIGTPAGAAAAAIVLDRAEAPKIWKTMNK
jgi:hypothetical protein